MITTFLYDTLGRNLFMKLFPVILTDRGSEFTDPSAIEFDKDGKRRTYVFYCDPQRSSQKAGIEVTHEFIRRILPKGTSFKDRAQLTAAFAMLISVSGGFCKPYFCFQCAVPELKFAKYRLSELKLANLN